MFDARLRPLIDVPLNAIARTLSGTGITPNMITGFGFFLGVIGRRLPGFQA